jgi:flagellar hook assembly protein FlgD
VRTLVDAHVAAGRRTATWDGTTDSGERAASGVYFVKMETTGPTDIFRANKKLVLLK